MNNKQNYKENNIGDISYLEFGYLLGENVRAVFSTAKNFNSRRIKENTNRDSSILKFLNMLKLDHVYTTDMKHTNIVGDLDKITDEDYWSYKLDDIKHIRNIPKEIDGLVALNRNDAIIMNVADCMPIYIYDTKLKSYGLVHSGWKGTLNNIILNGIDLLVKKGSNTKDLKLVIGPCISQDSFEVEEDVYTDFKNMLDKYNVCEKDWVYEKVNNQGKIKYHIDLKRIIIEVLKEKYGMNESQIITIDQDTYSVKTEDGKYKYHSHRRDREKAGRNLALIYIEN